MAHLTLCAGATLFFLLSKRSLLHRISPILHYQMAPIVDPSWRRMGSGFENPFQNVPGPFFPALPNLCSAKSRGFPSTTVPSTPSLQHSPLELEGHGQVVPSPCEQSSFECPDTLEPKQGEGGSEEPGANPRSDSLTPTPSLLSPTSTSSTSSEQEHTTEKTKRSRRRRRRNRHVEAGCVMGPRTVHLPLHIPYYWTHTHGAAVLPNLWSPGYRAVTGPGRDPWFEPQAVPGY
ncbi:hypothetical protein H4582DRAFT_1946487 [Lactarius indigo]|nr:hypothetical protein H4582DRAFT_1946487 [Lactarius indigo]